MPSEEATAEITCRRQVLPERVPLLKHQRLPGHLRSDEWIAIAIAANPRTKFHRCSAVAKNYSREQLLETQLELAKQVWQRLKEGRIKVVEAVVHLVENCGLSLSNFVSLPDGFDFSGKACLEALALSARQLR